MDFEVNVYNTPTSPEHLYKDISADKLVGTYKGTVRGEISVDAPEIVIEATLETGNYVRIDDFGRYYYIKDRNVLRTGLTELTLKSDPLMSFASQIKELTILADRCTKQAEPGDPVGYNALLPDPQLPITAASYYREFALPGLDFAYPTGYSSDTPQYILGVIG